VSIWVVRGGVTTPKNLMNGYVRHRRVPGLFGLSVQYAAGKSVAELARLGQLPNAQISYAYDDALAAALRPLGYAIRLVRSPGTGAHNTLAVLITASGTMLPSLPQDAADALSQTFRQRPNPHRVP
jgi:hypothetical protein